MRQSSRRERIRHGRKVIVHGLTARHLHFLKDVVVAAADENARLADAEVAHEAKVLLRRADPRRELRELQPQLHALFERLAVFLAVDEKLRLPDDAVRGEAGPLPPHARMQSDDPQKNKADIKK